MIRRLPLIVLLAASLAHAQPATGPATQPATQPATVAWRQTHPMRGMHGRTTLLDAGAPDGGYRVVGSSAFGNPDKSFTEQWWVLSVDREGRRRDLWEYVEEGNQAGVNAALALPERRTLVIGGMVEWVVQVDGDGTRRPPRRLDAGDFDTRVGAAVADEPDSILVAGAKTISYAEKPSLIDAWLARVRHDGTIVWQRSFDRAHQDMAAAILPLRDGGCVLAINSGKYSKFGTGPTALWLARCDAEGNKIADAVIEGAQIYAGGHKYLVPIGPPGAAAESGFVVSYTVGQLAGAMRFAGHVAAFDAKLKPMWSREFPGNSLYSTLIVNHGAEVVAVSSAIGGRPMLARLDPASGAVRRQATLPFDGNFDAKDLLAEPDGVVVVAAYQDRDRQRTDHLTQDVVVLKVR